MSIVFTKPQIHSKIKVRQLVERLDPMTDTMPKLLYECWSSPTSILGDEKSDENAIYNDDSETEDAMDLTSGRKSSPTNTKDPIDHESDIASLLSVMDDKSDENAIYNDDSETEDAMDLTSGNKRLLDVKGPDLDQTYVISPKRRKISRRPLCLFINYLGTRMPKKQPVADKPAGTSGGSIVMHAPLKTDLFNPLSTRSDHPVKAPYLDSVYSSLTKFAPIKLTALAVKKIPRQVKPETITTTAFNFPICPCKMKHPSKNMIQIPFCPTIPKITSAVVKVSRQA
jgi:hypothetical protein